MPLLRSRNLPLIVLVLVALFGAGCTVVTPSASLSPRSGSTEVNPSQPIKLALSGIGATVKKVEVKANGTETPAQLNGQRELLIDGRTRLDTDTTYQIKVVLTGLAGKVRTRHFVVKTVTTPQPLISADPQVVRFGEGIPIKWNVPIKGFKYELSPGLESRLTLSADRQTGTIEVFNYEQGQSFDVRITDAVGVNGWQMKDRNPGAVQRISTTAPITVDIEPVEGADDVDRSTEILVTFSEDIQNTEEASNFFVIDPAANGTWSWTQANQIKFTPAQGYAYETRVNVRVKGGPSTLRGANGGYLSRDFTSFFLTVPRQMIDVNLSSQSLTCYELGNPIFSCLISSGKSGYSTPTGRYKIYAKDRIAVMASAPGAEEEYYVPDVPYVSWVTGSVAIHGTYWHSSFGSVRSHGCINVSVSNGAWIFDWAPIGTPVNIHY